MSHDSWIQEVADNVEGFHRQHHPDRSKIVCASGISPSGPIHLGNLREMMTVHFVADELRRRGWDVDHIHSWDDFDRLRKTPHGIDPKFAENIGKPIAEIPDPFGEFASYADRHVHAFQESVAQLGVKPRYIRQSSAYRSGAYVQQIKIAMAARLQIFDELAKHQTKEDGVDAADKRQDYYPYRVYCESCNRDSTAITAYDEVQGAIAYSCSSCGYSAEFKLDEKCPGKLFWKIDWPMRWFYEGVDFEPGGEDHASPGSSYTVGKELVRDVFGGAAPHFIMYGFVGAAGRTKLSSSEGTKIVPSMALKILEPGVMRWLYCRREPRQKFNIDFGQEVLRLYDEWDSLARKVSQGSCTVLEKDILSRATATADGPVPAPARPTSFRLLSSLADVTLADTDEMLRVLGSEQEDSQNLDALQAELEPRLSCAVRWASEFAPEDERTVINAEFQAEKYAAFDDNDRKGIQLLLDQLEENWSLAGLTNLVYGVPKQLLNLPADIKPTDELKQVQRRFFIALYQMICSRDTGPRLPTLFLALKQDKLRKLLTPPA
jgi:lysyl-tRNA synthetase, class I